MMKKLTVNAVVLMASMALAGAAFAGTGVKIGGSVKQNITTKDVTQAAAGKGIKQSLNVGGVKGNVKVGGDVKMNIETGSVTQVAAGKGIKQDLSIGGIEGN